MGQGEKQAPDLAELGRAVRRVRERNAISVGELATACAVSAASIDALERGRLDPSYELLHALAHGLGMRPSELIALAEQLSD